MDKSPIYQEILQVPSCHCSMLHVFSDGSLIVGFFAGSYEKATDVAIWGANGDPSGTTWTNPRVLAGTPGKSEGSPVFHEDDNGTLHLWYLTMHDGRLIKGGWSVCTIKHTTSIDRGTTWTPWNFLRNNWFWVIRCAAIQLQDGSVLLPMHREAIKFESMFYRNPSKDLSGKWKRCGRLQTPKGCLEPSACELSDGSLLCSLRTLDGVVYFSRSADHGLSWSKPTPSSFPNPNSQTALHCTTTGKVILALNPLRKGRHWLAYTVSDDESETWGPLETIDGDSSDAAASQEYSYPSIVELQDGHILVSYTWNRKQIWYAKFSV